MLNQVRQGILADKLGYDYAVPDEVVGDQVMAALELQDPEAFDPAAFDTFLADQDDLGTKWAPRYVRISRSLPLTPTSKVRKHQLCSERWECEEAIWLRPEKGDGLRPMDPEDREAIGAAFAARGRASLLICPSSESSRPSVRCALLRELETSDARAKSHSGFSSIL